MNFIEHLTKEHRRYENDLKALINVEKVDKEKLQSVLKELQQHMVKEEKYLYPEAEDCLNKSDQIEMVQDGYFEHTQAKDFIIKLTNTDYLNQKTLKDDMKELLQELEHHHEDEETELFPKMREKLSKADIKSISISMDAFDANQSSFVTA